MKTNLASPLFQVPSSQLYNHLFIQPLNPNHNKFSYLHNLNKNLTLNFAAMVLSQIDYFFVEETSTSPLFGFIDLFLGLAFFNKIHKFFSTLWFFLFCQVHSGSSIEVRVERKVSESNELSNGGRESGEMVIERDEVKMVMERMGFFCSSESEELDEKYGSKELCQVFEENEPSLVEVKQAFDVFDENKDGFINAMELQRVLVILGLKEGLEFENCEKMIKRFDENQDGRIDFIEFVNIMRNQFC